MVAVTIHSDFGAQQNKVWHCFHCFSIYFPWSFGTRYHIFVFWMLNFKPTFSLSSFTFLKRLWVVASSPPRTLDFLPWQQSRWRYLIWLLPPTTFSISCLALLAPPPPQPRHCKGSYAYSRTQFNLVSLVGLKEWQPYKTNRGGRKTLLNCVF